MNELQIFNYNGSEVRTIQKDGEPWWVLKDVCNILSIRNPADVFIRLDEDEKGVGQIDTLGGKQHVNIVNESGLYNVILRSDKPEAKPFRKWVTSEVLPSIRKHGGYLTPQKIEEILINPDTIINLATALKKEKEKTKALEVANAVQQQQIAELNPKATYYDLVLQCPDLISVTELAKDYGKSAKWLNKILAENKVQCKQGGIWFLYDKYAKKGYTSTKKDTFADKNGVMHTKAHTYWTQKGRLFLYSFLKELGYLPIVEQQQDAS